MTRGDLVFTEAQHIWLRELLPEPKACRAFVDACVPLVRVSRAALFSQAAKADHAETRALIHWLGRYHHLLADLRTHLQHAPSDVDDELTLMTASPSPCLGSSRR